MSDIQSYRDLLVWLRAMELVEAVYALVKKFPKAEETGRMLNALHRKLT
ncbi:MAG: four helix bundle protein [Pseudomonadota bacterium]